ncbi:MAG: CoB--CoM heterodisulfide reductase iron-sulfur subunit B family protein [Anaerolineae bacterium]
MKYLFYPGCSMDTSALEYKRSTVAVLETLGAEVEEIPDWTCCGASAASVVSELLGHVLPARNLALAEQIDEELTIIAGCSACYTNFRRTHEAVTRDPALLERVNRALEVEELTYRGEAQVRHLMDVLANDFSPEELASRVQRPLTDLVVAPYYGCQTVRPFSPYDDDQAPTSMLPILEALGVTIHRHNREASCCGTSLLMTKQEVGVGMVAEILDASEGADCVVTVCPMCQLNVEGYQDKVSKVLERRVSLPVLFLPQLMGLAFGLPDDVLMFDRHIVSVKPVLSRLEQAAPVPTG